MSVVAYEFLNVNLGGRKRVCETHPANYLDSYEKFLRGVATKGVNKAQHAQKGLDPLSYKDAKAIRKWRKETFFSALGKPSKPVDTPAKGHTSKGEENREGPA
ncbi:uncharacterized protein LOC115982843 isoform X2 [Quercus lobata]|uniref:uncharacterized protein LOC115982843 isoform X2 n=1 Tax=Quercus lobata TaxID=97700 RepID=UPI001247E298|nr:uncharacterized protein LOC115982843 isoform X2 [Quercus lobata]